MVTFADAAVLNVYPDGSKSLNDQNGMALDPATGQPTEAPGPIPTPPDMGPDRLLRLMNGDDEIADVNEAMGLFDAFKEALQGEIDPLEMIKVWFEMVLQVAKALETEERGVQMRAWCYSVLYGSLDIGNPPEPTFANSLQGPDQDDLDRQAWRNGVAAGQQELGNGADGTKLRNRLLLLVAHDGGQPSVTITKLWQAACTRTEDWQLAKAYPNLDWPLPIGA